MAGHERSPILSFETQEAWAAWLAEHGAESPGIWLKFAKKGSGIDSVAKPEAIEAAIVQGWIDGQLDRFDDRFWLVRFTPRGPKSRWSQINRETAERLLAEGRLAPAGLAEVDKAKRDGRWEAAYASQAKAEVPDDLQAALDGRPKAKAFFATLSGANRFAILYRIQDAKKAETRAARIETFTTMLELGQTIHPSRPKR